MALTRIAPPATGSSGEDGLVTMPPLELAATRVPVLRTCHFQALLSPVAPASAVRLVKWTVLR